MIDILILLIAISVIYYIFQKTPIGLIIKTIFKVFAEILMTTYTILNFLYWKLNKFRNKLKSNMEEPSDKKKIVDFQKKKKARG